MGSTFAPKVAILQAASKIILHFAVTLVFVSLVAEGFHVPTLRCYAKGSCGQHGYHQSQVIVSPTAVLQCPGRRYGHVISTFILRTSSSLLSTSAVNDGSTVLGSFYMLLLALQFACQPMLAKQYAPKNIVKGSYVLVQDLTRVVASFALLMLTGSWRDAVSCWSWSTCLMAAGLPAVLYLLQNYCALQAYQNLSPITFNVLNQSKTLSAAVCCYFLLGQHQSLQQVFALFLLLVSALVMESIIPIPSVLGGKTRHLQADAEERRTRWALGVIPVLVASLLSGLAGAFCQQSLQDFHRNSLLFSMEMASISSIFNIANLCFPWSPEGRRWRDSGIRVGWTTATFLPIASNAAGGILVGLVTKYSGSVQKGFALILGMFLSGFLQNRFSRDESQVTASQWIGGVIAALSFAIYTLCPAKR